MLPCEVRNMAHPSISIPDDVLDELDDEIWDLQKDEIVRRGDMRSKFVTAILSDWLETDDFEQWVRQEHPELLTLEERGNPNRTTMTAD